MLKRGKLSMKQRKQKSERPKQTLQVLGNRTLYQNKQEALSEQQDTLQQAGSLTQRLRLPTGDLLKTIRTHAAAKNKQNNKAG
tara:strand:- start:255 stop:503 length:249 start_codon:yes stop_codon:yes gene_type:complete